MLCMFHCEIISSGGGVLVVGQEQDSRGGKFSSAESYVGKISKLNIWDRELNMDEIQSQSTNCDEVIGNLVAWPDFLAGLNGRVGYMDTQLCKGDQYYLRLDFQGSVVVLIYVNFILGFSIIILFFGGM